MARTPQWVRTINGFTSLTTTTQFLTLTPGSIPDFSTLTRMVGTLFFDYAPDRDPASSAAALIACGIGVFSVPAAVDPALPNSFPHIFTWWGYQVVRAGFYGTYTDGLTPGTNVVNIDVHGQRQVDSVSNSKLCIWARLVSPISGVGVTPTASLRIGLQHLYLLPEA